VTPAAFFFPAAMVPPVASCFPALMPPPPVLLTPRPTIVTAPVDRLNGGVHIGETIGLGRGSNGHAAKERQQEQAFRIDCFLFSACNHGRAARQMLGRIVAGIRHAQHSYQIRWAARSRRPVERVGSSSLRKQIRQRQLHYASARLSLGHQSHFSPHHSAIAYGGGDRLARAALLVEVKA